MKRQSSAESTTVDPLPEYRAILLGADASDHSNRGIKEAIRLGQPWSATIFGAHVYAAKMHDIRFRQMEGGLPEPYQEEVELERQRDIHDELITKGLSVITDSYLDQVEAACSKAGLSYVRRALEGKNYRELVNEANSGQYDLLVMGALGLGAIPGSRIGTLCERVVRRAQIDTLIIKEPKREITAGPIVVALDGSTRAYGGLLSAIAIAKAQAQPHQMPIHVIAAYDPYYHYVAFNRIAEVLSEEAGKIFRFKEQEALHESIIDKGLAKIYEGHLLVAQSIAQEYDVTLCTQLLDGKAHDAIEKYVKAVEASLLVVGKLGIHADQELDIGGNTENLLRNVGCALLISQRDYRPRVDVVAEATTSWTHQAEKRMEKIPSFARNMARLAILRFAQERGHTVITENIVTEATEKFCPAGQARRRHGTEDQNHPTTKAAGAFDSIPFDPTWSEEANVILDAIRDEALRTNLRRRAEKKARQEKSSKVEAGHIQAFMRINKKATTPEAEKPGKCPFGFGDEASNQAERPWTDEAKRRLSKIPQGFMRTLTRKRIEAFAIKQGYQEITPQVIDEKYQAWAEGSKDVTMSLKWDEHALAKIARIPDFVRPMVIKEVERCARIKGMSSVTLETVSKASESWASKGEFHSDGNRDLYRDE